MKEPKGADLMKTLIELLAEQEGFKADYTIEINGEEIHGTTGR